MPLGCCGLQSNSKGKYSCRILTLCKHHTRCCFQPIYLCLPFMTSKPQKYSIKKCYYLDCIGILVCPKYQSNVLRNVWCLNRKDYEMLSPAPLCPDTGPTIPELTLGLIFPPLVERLQWCGFYCFTLLPDLLPD